MQLRQLQQLSRGEQAAVTAADQAAVTLFSRGCERHETAGRSADGRAGRLVLRALMG